MVSNVLLLGLKMKRTLKVNLCCLRYNSSRWKPPFRTILASFTPSELNFLSIGSRVQIDVYTDSCDKFDVLIGNRVWMEENKIQVLPQVDHIMRLQENMGETAILCSINGKF